jgi:hypothetical protein
VATREATCEQTQQDVEPQQSSEPTAKRGKAKWQKVQEVIQADGRPQGMMAFLFSGESPKQIQNQDRIRNVRRNATSGGQNRFKLYWYLEAFSWLSAEFRALPSEKLCCGGDEPPWSNDIRQKVPEAFS